MILSRILAGLCGMVLAGGVAAQEWQEPPRGSATRSDLLSAIRPHAEWALGASVEFVVHELRVAPGIAFAMLAPQRPGGGRIDPARTPAALRGEFDVDFMDGLALQVLYVQSGRVWVALHWHFGATDVWWADPLLCLRFSPVTPEVCR